MQSQSTTPLATHFSDTCPRLAHWVASLAKKSSVKSHDMSQCCPPRFSSLLQPKPPPPKDNEVALPHSESVTNLTKLCREFSRCLRPSLSSKRPLRVRPVARRRPQSSSLNEIFNCQFPPSTKFTRLSLSPVSTRKGLRGRKEQSDSLSLKTTDSILAPCVQAYRDSNITVFPLPVTFPDFQLHPGNSQLPTTYTVLLLHRQDYLYFALFRGLTVTNYAVNYQPFARFTAVWRSRLLRSAPIFYPCIT